jgi:hypothetical protein
LKKRLKFAAVGDRSWMGIGQLASLGRVFKHAYSIGHSVS